MTTSMGPGRVLCRPQINRTWWLWALFLLVLPEAGRAQYTYTTNADNTLAITSYSGSGGAVSIPSNIVGKTVTSIGDDAFRGCTSLTGVIIPNSVTSIGVSAFQGCFNLTAATIPNSVTRIGGYAFYQCDRLASLVIPAGVTEIYEMTFAWCESLASVAIPDGVMYIDESAFYRCASLTGITLPNNLVEIGNMAFSSCFSLSNITIPNGVTFIGFGAFQNCSSLASVIIGSGVNMLGGIVFGECGNLRKVFFCGNAPGGDTQDIFLGSSNVTVYHLSGTTGWTNPWCGRPTVLYCPEVPDGLDNNGDGQIDEGARDGKTCFSINQSIKSTGSGWSRTFVMDLTNFRNIVAQDGYQSYTVNHSLYYNIWTGIYLYDYGAGAFSAVAWLLNLDL